MADGKPRKRRHYTLRKLIDVAVRQLCPQGKPGKPVNRGDGVMVVQVDLPVENLDAPKEVG